MSQNYDGTENNFEYPSCKPEWGQGPLVYFSS